MRPPQVFVVTIIVSTHAGYHIEHQIDKAVIIAIVIFEIQAPDDISRVNSSLKDITELTRLHITVILAVVYFVRANNIELGLELTIRVVREIVTNTASKHLIIIPLIVLLVHHASNDFLIVFTRKALVFKLYEDNQSLEIGIVGGTTALCTMAGQCRLLVHGSRLLRHLRSLTLADTSQESPFRRSTFCLIVSHLGSRLQLTALFLGIDIISACVLDDGIAVKRCLEMAPLVTNQSECHVSAIGLLHLHWQRMCWYALHATYAKQQCHEQQQTTLSKHYPSKMYAFTYLYIYDHS